jgi:hypothetical protein
MKRERIKKTCRRNSISDKLLSLTFFVYLLTVHVYIQTIFKTVSNKNII